MNNCPNRLDMLKRVFEFIGAVLFLVTAVLQLLLQIHH